MEYSVVVNQSDESGRTEDESYGNTRRQFVVGSAGALSGLAVGGTVAGSVMAQEDEEEEDEEEDEEMVEDEFEDDIEILNYALTLEYLEADFYRQALENISEEELCNCRALRDEGYLQETVMDRLETIQEHEESHAETLVETIESLDGEPIDEPEFDFGLAVEYPMAFLATAAQLEDTGVSAYAGAAPSIENEDLVAPALGIHSVEARHASYVRTLADQVPFPDVIDEARTRAEVEELASGFIVDDDDDLDDDDDPDDDETETPDDDDDLDDDFDDETETPGENATDTPGENATDTPGENATDTPGN